MSWAVVVWIKRKRERRRDIFIIIFMIGLIGVEEREMNVFFC